MKNIRVISEDENYKKILAKAKIAAATDATILIRGENGCGKEVLTDFIYQNSLRANKKMVVVNCAAIPEHLIESELFGYEDGAFTGAKRGGKTGKFEQANGGTIFLDEIGDMPYAMQAKLLRVLQQGEIEKIGRQKAIPVDVRIIAATNQPLEELIAEKRFRMDLFYRLNVISFKIPPLRERKKDILALSRAFLEQFNLRYHKYLGISSDVMDRLLSYSWPGNVRELQNCIESAVIICDTKNIELTDLPQYLQMSETIFAEEEEKTAGEEEKKTEEKKIMNGFGEISSEKKDNITDFRDYRLRAEELCQITDLQAETRKYETALIRQMIDYCDGNKSMAAKHLNVSIRSLYRKLNGTDPVQCISIPV